MQSCCCKRNRICRIKKGPRTTPNATIAKFYLLRYELLSHPANCPDLTLFDYHLLLNVRKWLCGKILLGSNKEIIVEHKPILGASRTRKRKIGESLKEMYRAKRRVY